VKYEFRNEYKFLKNWNSQLSNNGGAQKHMPFPRKHTQQTTTGGEEKLKEKKNVKNNFVKIISYL
jgi:hypothetical protein